MRLISFQLTGSITLTLADSEFSTKIGAAKAGRQRNRPAPNRTSRPRDANKNRCQQGVKITKKAFFREAPSVAAITL